MRSEDDGVNRDLGEVGAQLENRICQRRLSGTWCYWVWFNLMFPHVMTTILRGFEAVDCIMTTALGTNSTPAHISPLPRPQASIDTLVLDKIFSRTTNDSTN